MLSAIYINELLVYLLHKDDVHEAIFERYHDCLYSLEKESNLELTLRIFEASLLELLGFGLSLHTEADTGEQVVAGTMYDYHIEHGPVRSRDGSVSGVPRISGDCLIALANDQYPLIAMNAGYLAELKQLMRCVISHHLGNKKLKSRELFRLAGSS